MVHNGPTPREGQRYITNGHHETTKSARGDPAMSIGKPTLWKRAVTEWTTRKLLTSIRGTRKKMLEYKKLRNVIGETKKPHALPATRKSHQSSVGRERRRRRGGKKSDHEQHPGDRPASRGNKWGVSLGSVRSKGERRTKKGRRKEG